ncbi:acyl-CoA thioesterase [Microbulbifer sp. OS29]|uniref:Acyl-CoA thioesterase n=1 Tax=Microbulbifer okhotskensis TaxID=2926617 RepID=A0A9X2J850_9GAMM|nr:thioesterase family protein [Microbulbifer okhotskensis]MCO1336495.1 acyl-CoA thioesterase [Microbulbifer okhotskensis]
MSRQAVLRSDYFCLEELTTRWMDNDVYGHVNNVVYYSYFDTIANNFLISQAGFDIYSSEVIGYMVKSNCNYVTSISYPDKIKGGFRVNRIGNSSVEYGVAIFKDGYENACAHGAMTHVFVNRHTEKPTKISGHLLKVLQKACV